MALQIGDTCSSLFGYTSLCLITSKIILLADMSTWPMLALYTHLQPSLHSALFLTFSYLILGVSHFHDSLQLPLHLCKDFKKSSKLSTLKSAAPTLRKTDYQSYFLIRLKSPTITFACHAHSPRPRMYACTPTFHLFASWIFLRFKCP